MQPRGTFLQRAVRFGLVFVPIYVGAMALNWWLRHVPVTWPMILALAIVAVGVPVGLVFGQNVGQRLQQKKAP